MMRIRIRTRTLSALLSAVALFVTVPAIAQWRKGAIELTLGSAWQNLEIAQQPTSDLFDLFNQHSDPTTQINAQNVEQLQLAWQITPGSFVSHAPLVEDGRVYFADWGGQSMLSMRTPARSSGKIKSNNP